MSRSILHLIPTLSGGGAEKQLALLGGALVNAGFRVHIGYVHDGVNSQLARSGGVLLHRLHAFSSYDPLLLLRVLRLMRATHTDIVQTWLPQMDVIGGLAARRAAVPAILTERSSAAAYPRNLKHALRVRVGRHAAAVVANSESGLQYWSARGYAARQRIIRNAVVLDGLMPMPGAAPPAQEHERIILVVGRLSPEKNLERLITALDQVLRARPQYVALLCGEGPLRGRLEHQIATLPTRANIRLTGFRTDLAFWMGRAAMLVSPSLFEGHPNAVLEAMALGCPVVVSDIRQHREILDEHSALFFSPDSPADLAAAIERAIDNEVDARARAAVARAKAALFTLATASAAYRELYETILTDSRRKE